MPQVYGGNLETPAGGARRRAACAFQRKGDAFDPRAASHVRERRQATTCSEMDATVRFKRLPPLPSPLNSRVLQYIIKQP